MIHSHHLRDKVHIAIIGGNGFIGRNLIKRLSTYSDVRIWSIDKNRNNIPIDTTGYKAIVEQLNMNVSEPDCIKVFLAARPLDVVIYLASCEAPTDGIGDLKTDSKAVAAAINTITSYGSIPLYEADDVRPYFMYVSSWSVYGENPSVPWTEESTLIPANYTGMGKMYVEDIIMKYMTALDVPWCILRPTEVFGKKHYTEANRRGYWPGYLHYYLDKVLKREPEIEVISPDTEIDLIHVNYLTKVIVQCISEYRKGIYNVSSGHTTKLFDLVKLIQQQYGSEVSKLVPSTRLNIENMSVDSSLMQKTMPYEPSKYPVDLFLEKYIPIRRLELAREKAIEEIIKEPKMLDSTAHGAKAYYEGRKEKRILAYKEIKEIAGENFKYIRYGRFQERARELLNLPPGEETDALESPVPNRMIEKVEEIFKLEEDEKPVTLIGRDKSYDAIK
jgi:UDP-glucose 4-epimerase